MSIRIIYLPTAELACTRFPGESLEAVQSIFNNHNRVFYRAAYDNSIVCTLNDTNGGFAPIPEKYCIPKYLLEIIEIEDDDG
ncbi:MAG: hypothetical protein JHC33_05410 [Ignisphaera sp.]|nr:hypothetical protein [Ignisphaera sp.]